MIKDEIRILENLMDRLESNKIDRHDYDKNFAYYLSRIITELNDRIVELEEIIDFQHAHNEHWLNPEPQCLCKYHQGKL